MSELDDFKDEPLPSIKNESFTSKESVSSITNISNSTSTSQQNTKKETKNVNKGQISPEITQYLKALENNENDKEAWKNLAKSLQSTNLEEAISVFQLILKTFPTSGLFLRMFCEIQEKARNFPAIENVLQKNMRKCGTMDIYAYYCSFFEKKLLFHKAGDDLIIARKQVDQVYQQILDEVGLLYDSDVVWKLYKTFLEKQPRNDQDQQFVEMLRSFFHKVITLPIRNVDVFWKDFTEFETSQVIKMEISEEEKKELIKQQLSPFVELQAKAVQISKKRGEFWTPINMDNLAIPVLTEEDIRQVSLFHQALNYEESNPMNYDLTVFHSSMKCLWSRYLALFRYCPDVWIEYAEYESEWNWEDSVSILKEGFEVMNNSCLFGLACCDFYEKHGHLEEAERQYEIVVSTCDNAVGWIQYMYFSRRNKGMEASRQIFRRGRLSVLSPSLFIAAAHLEYDINHQKQSALAVLEAGLIHFSTSIEYILDYVDCLLNWNEIDNACILLENSIQIIGQDMSSALWEKLLFIQQNYSMNHLSLSILSQTEESYYSSNQENKSLNGLLGKIHRYVYDNFHPISLEDRVLLKRMDKNHLLREEGTRKLLVTNKKVALPVVEGIITNTEAPEWLQLYLQKIPSFEREKARGNTVDEVTSILARCTIPSLRTFVKP